MQGLSDSEPKLLSPVGSSEFTQGEVFRIVIDLLTIYYSKFIVLIVM